MNDLCMLVCANELGYIGKGNGLMYNIKNDMKRFKSLTTDNVVIMGRKTLESLPKGKPLKNRMNYVITRNKDLLNSDSKYNNLKYVDSIESAIELANLENSDKTNYIIGGAEIYNYCLKNKLYDSIELTLVFDRTIGDTKIDLDLRDYNVTSNTGTIIDGDLQYRFITLTK